MQRESLVDDDGVTSSSDGGPVFNFAALFLNATKERLRGLWAAADKNTRQAYSRENPVTGKPSFMKCARSGLEVLNKAAVLVHPPTVRSIRLRSRRHIATISSRRRRLEVRPPSEMPVPKQERC
eukprot:1294036-Pleurochrysis_carterae.AAC.5